MKAYPLPQLYEEMAFIAFHFHCPSEHQKAHEHAEPPRRSREKSTNNRRHDGRPDNPFDLG